MTRKKIVDHIVMRPKGCGCAHCGEELNILPCRISVFTAAAEAFSKSHRHCKPGATALTAPTTLREWASSWDMGVSSATIYRVFTGRLPVGWDESSPYPNDAPYDDADFGRCVRLLDLEPKWRERLHEVAAKVPAFAPLVPEWARLEELHQAGKSGEVYAEIRRLRWGGWRVENGHEPAP